MSHNKVLPRHMEDSHPQRRNWSMEAWEEHGHPCNNSEALLAALANGQRRWASGIRHIESVPSNFEFGGDCGVSLPTRGHACKVLERAGRVLLLGDSHTRHVYLGLRILTSGNIVSGGLDHTSSSCRCDGQFSEALSCRNLTLTSQPCQWRRGGNVSGLLQFVPLPLCRTKCFCMRSKPLVEVAVATDSQPITAVVLHIGYHVIPLTAPTILARLECVLQTLREHAPHAVLFVIGLVAQSLTLDSLYPHQARARVRDIDNEIASKTAVKWPGVRMLRVFNLTYAAPGPQEEFASA